MKTLKTLAVVTALLTSITTAQAEITCWNHQGMRVCGTIAEYQKYKRDQMVNEAYRNYFGLPNMNKPVQKPKKSVAEKRRIQRQKEGYRYQRLTHKEAAAFRNATERFRKQGGTVTEEQYKKYVPYLKRSLKYAKKSCELLNQCNHYKGAKKMLKRFKPGMDWKTGR